MDLDLGEDIFIRIVLTGINVHITLIKMVIIIQDMTLTTIRDMVMDLVMDPTALIVKVRNTKKIIYSVNSLINPKDIRLLFITYNVKVF